MTVRPDRVLYGDTGCDRPSDDDTDTGGVGAGDVSVGTGEADGVDGKVDTTLGSVDGCVVGAGVNKLDPGGVDGLAAVGTYDGDGTTTAGGGGAAMRT